MAGKTTVEEEKLFRILLSLSSLVRRVKSICMGYDSEETVAFKYELESGEVHVMNTLNCQCEWRGQ